MTQRLTGAFFADSSADAVAAAKAWLAAEPHLRLRTICSVRLDDPIFWCDHDDDLLEQERARALPVIEAARGLIEHHPPRDPALAALRATLAAYEGDKP